MHVYFSKFKIILHKKDLLSIDAYVKNLYLISSSLEAFIFYLDERADDNSPSIHHWVVWFVCTRGKNMYRLAPDHKRNKPARLKTIFHRGRKSNSR